MKKIASIVSVVLIICILAAGIFSAGLIVGKLYLPQDVEISQSPTEAPIFADPTTVENEALAEESVETISPTHPPISETPQINVPPPSDGLENLFVPFWEAWDIVQEYYVDQPVDDQALMEGAIEGMLSVMDVYTHTMGVEIPGLDEYNNQSNTPPLL